MLSAPFQNSDFLHRAEVISDLRNQEAILQNASRQNAEESVKANEQRKEEQVGETPESELDPDGHNPEKRGVLPRRIVKKKLSKVKKDATRPSRFLRDFHKYIRA